MVYIRGNARTSTTGGRWATGAGATRSTALLQTLGHKAEGGDEFHGVDGPLWVEVAAADEARARRAVCPGGGADRLPRNADFNGASQEGAGFYQLNIRRGGARALPHLPGPVRGRPNLVLATGALCQRVLLRDQRAAASRIPSQQCSGNCPRPARGDPVQGLSIHPSCWNYPVSAIPTCSPGWVSHHWSTCLGWVKTWDHLTINIQQGLHGLITFYEGDAPPAHGKEPVQVPVPGPGPAGPPRLPGGRVFRSDAARTRPDAQVHFAPRRQ